MCKHKLLLLLFWLLYLVLLLSLLCCYCSCVHCCCCCCCRWNCRYLCCRCCFCCRCGRCCRQPFICLQTELWTTKFQILMVNVRDVILYRDLNRQGQGKDLENKRQYSFSIVVYFRPNCFVNFFETIFENKV